jgi:hypothetical protein
LRLPLALVLRLPCVDVPAGFLQLGVDISSDGRELLLLLLVFSVHLSELLSGKQDELALQKNLPLEQSKQEPIHALLSP